MADATIIVGIIASINPFFFPAKIVYITGMFMVIASFFLLRLIKTGKTLTRLEGFLLLVFWLIYAIAEFLIGKS